jgi:hypothetical protein
MARAVLLLDGPRIIGPALRLEHSDIEVQSSTLDGDGRDDDEDDEDDDDDDGGSR